VDRAGWPAEAESDRHPDAAGAGGDWPKQIGTIPLGDDFDRWRRGDCILLSSHHRFKGLEADALLLADMPVPDQKPSFSTANFYVACSRAKHHLTVISRPNQ
jgi:hypothetical protein